MADSCSHARIVAGLCAGDGAFKYWRQRASADERLRLARKPKWRIFTNPDGKTCSRNRRMNSTASNTIVLVRLLCRESRHRKVTLPLSSDSRRLLEIATRCV